MKKILRSWGFPLALVCFGASTAWAAFGPCNITRPGVFNTTIGCYGRFVPFAMECHCGGMAAIRPEHSACANANAIPCTEILVESIILFRSEDKAFQPPRDKLQCHAAGQSESADFYNYSCRANIKCESLFLFFLC